MIELDAFKKIPAGTIFRIVTEPENGVTFVCKKGEGYDDWAIYYGPSIWGADRVKTSGDKLTSKTKIQNIFPCSDEVFARYRF